MTFNDPGVCWLGLYNLLKLPMTSQCETGYSMTTSKPSRAALGHSRAPYPYMLWSLVYSQHAMESPPTSNASSQ